jgi:aryl-alcohol dehydrogenase-like predicted oxidoreductase
MPLVFGGAPIGGLYEPVSDADAAATLEAAWQAGIRAFDTAPHYGAGLSERRLGDFLAGRARTDYIVSTKVGRRLVPASGPVEGAEGFYGTPALSRVRDYSRDGVRASLEDSLRRLRLDRVDIALIHDPEDFMTQALDSAYPALAGLREEGVVRAIGLGMNLPAPSCSRCAPTAACGCLRAAYSTAGSWPTRGTARITTTLPPPPRCSRGRGGSGTSAPATAFLSPRRRCGSRCATRR